MNNLDHLAREDYKKSEKSAVFWWLVASFAYYHRFVSLLSDDVFDKMSKVILDKQIHHSLYSHLISEDDLRAGSGFAIAAWQYPLSIVKYAEDYIKLLENK